MLKSSLRILISATALLLVLVSTSVAAVIFQPGDLIYTIEPRYIVLDVNETSQIFISFMNRNINYSVPLVRLRMFIEDPSIINLSSNANTSVRDIAPAENRFITINVTGLKEGETRIRVFIEAPEALAPTMELIYVYVGITPTPTSISNPNTSVNNTQSNEVLYKGIAVLVSLMIAIAVIAYLQVRRR
jgi:hypothetical protein